MSFEGSFQCAFDDKWRVTIPASFREDIRRGGGDTVILARALVKEAPCIEVRTVDAWEALKAQYAATPALDDREESLRRFTLQVIHRATLDKQGRISVPPGLRAFAFLNKDVFIASWIGCFRLWDPDLWNQVDAEDLDVLAPNRARFFKKDA